MNTCIIQHIQTDHYSLILKKLNASTLILQWEDVIENYEIQVLEVEALRNAIENYVDREGPVKLLVKTYRGITVPSQIQKVLQHKQLYMGIKAVAVELKSTTHRLSLNFSTQFKRNRIPVRAFTSQIGAEKWLKKK